MDKLTYKPLPHLFYDKPTLELAVDLLGCLLVKESEEGVTAGYIVECEAYIGPEDKAAHSYNNRRTKRTEVMFHKSGLAYTYVMHTHCLFNVVSGGMHNPEAILIRALEPSAGLDLMEARRPGQSGFNLTNGPGKLTKAMDITMDDYGHDLTSPPLYIAKGRTPERISAGKRIGIENSEEARDYPWRYWVTGNLYVSRHQKGQAIKGL